MRAHRRLRSPLSLLSAVALASVVVACGTPDTRVEMSQAPRPAPPVPADELTPLAGSVLEAPAPVTGADGLEHIAYELVLINPTSLLVTLQRVEILDDRGQVNRTIEGDAIPELLTVFGTGPGTTFGAGQGGVMILDATANRPRRVPSSLVHRIEVSLEVSPGVPFDNSDGVLATTFETGPTAVLDDKPVVISPPLRGEHWWDGIGCCAVRNPHRGAVLAVNGAFHATERYAIDWVRLDDEGRLFVGPIDQLSSWHYYGAPIHAVADGRVVNLLDGLPDQTPGALPTGITAATAGGNYIVQDIGGGNYAFYAHMQPNSLRFEIGDMVREGEVIGLLGNSGNTDAPHLHFHVMDGLAPLSSKGVPYEFTRFTGEGVVTNTEEVIAGEPAAIDTSTLSGRFRRVLPLDQQVVTFPE
jgi:hypothetical protein